jgi:transcription elongation factor GreA-like protein
MVNNLFKRANYAIIDLKYILSSIPTVWSDKMLKNVSQAVESFLKLLSYMQVSPSKQRSNILYTCREITKLV